MARGIPRPLVLEVPDLFLLLDSQRNRFYHSSAPRILAKTCRGPQKHWISFKYENFRKFSEFVEILLSLYLFFRISFWYYYPTLKYKINADSFLNFFQTLFEFLGDFQEVLVNFLINHSSKFPKDPEEQISPSSIPEECKFAIPWLLNSSRNEILLGIAISTSDMHFIKVLIW